MRKKMSRKRMSRRTKKRGKMDGPEMDDPELVRLYYENVSDDDYDDPDRRTAMSFGVDATETLGERPSVPILGGTSLPELEPTPVTKDQGEKGKQREQREQRGKGFKSHKNSAFDETNKKGKKEK